MPRRIRAVRLRIDQETRDAVTTIIGWGGVLWEMIIEHVDRPALLALFGGMIGLPAVLGLERNKEEESKEENPPDPTGREETAS